MSRRQALLSERMWQLGRALVTEACPHLEHETLRDVSVDFGTDEITIRYRGQAVRTLRVSDVEVEVSPFDLWPAGI